MGIYLSTPCSDVECEEGEGNGVKYAVAEMQVWQHYCCIVCLIFLMLTGMEKKHGRCSHHHP